MTVPFKTDCELGDIVEFVNGGAWSQSAYSESGVPVVRVTNIRGDHIDLSECKYLPLELLQKYKKHLLRTGDLVIATVGSHPTQPNSVVGRPAVVSDKIDGCLLNQNAVLLRGKSSRVDQRWLGYLGKSAQFRSYIIECARGSANQVRMSIALLKKMPVEVPTLGTQRRIASLLGAYDDLIEVNRRRIALLEEMARGLFEEWFVRFRFPGHEEVAILDTPDGPLPEGWRYDILGNVSAINAASLRPANAPLEIGYIDISSVSPGRIDAINRMPFVEAPGRARRIVTDGSILWSNVRPNRRSFAVVLHPTPEIVASTGFTVLDARETSFAYLYYWVTTDYFVGYLVGNAQGAAYPAVTATTFERAAILLPSSILVERFTDLAEPMLRLADSLRKTNGSLVASRDLLLPRLISGELSVAQAEFELEEAA